MFFFIVIPNRENRFIEEASASFPFTNRMYKSQYMLLFSDFITSSLRNRIDMYLLEDFMAVVYSKREWNSK